MLVTNMWQIATAVSLAVVLAQCCAAHGLRPDGGGRRLVDAFIPATTFAVELNSGSTMACGVDNKPSISATLTTVTLDGSNTFSLLGKSTASLLSESKPFCGSLTNQKEAVFEFVAPEDGFYVVYVTVAGSSPATIYTAHCNGGAMYRSTSTSPVPLPACNSTGVSSGGSTTTALIVNLLADGRYMIFVDNLVAGISSFDITVALGTELTASPSLAPSRSPTSFRVPGPIVLNDGVTAVTCSPGGFPSTPGLTSSIEFDLEGDDTWMEGRFLTRSNPFGTSSSLVITSCPEEPVFVGEEDIFTFVATDDGKYEIEIQNSAFNDRAGIIVAQCVGGVLRELLWEDKNNQPHGSCQAHQDPTTSTSSLIFRVAEGERYFVIVDHVAEPAFEAYALYDLNMRLLVKTVDPVLDAQIAATDPAPPTSHMMLRANGSVMTCTGGMPSIFAKPLFHDVIPEFDVFLLENMYGFETEPDFSPGCAQPQTPEPLLERVIAIIPSVTAAYSFVPAFGTAYVTIAQCSGGILYRTEYTDVSTSNVRPACNPDGAVTTQLQEDVAYYMVIQVRGIPRNFLMGVVIEQLDRINPTTHLPQVFSDYPTSAEPPLNLLVPILRNDGSPVNCTNGRPVLDATALVSRVSPRSPGTSDFTFLIMGGFPAELRHGCGSAVNASQQERMVFFTPLQNGTHIFTLAATFSLANNETLTLGRCVGGRFYKAVSGTIAAPKPGCTSANLGGQENITVAADLIRGVNYFAIVDTAAVELTAYVLTVEAAEIPGVVPPLPTTVARQPSGKVVKRAGSDQAVQCTSGFPMLLGALNGIYLSTSTNGVYIAALQNMGTLSEVQASCSAPGSPAPASTNERILYFLADKSGTWTIEAENSVAPMTITVSHCSGDTLYESEFVDSRGITAKACSAVPLKALPLATRLIVPLTAGTLYFIILKNAPASSLFVLTVTRTSESMEAPSSPNGEGPPALNLPLVLGAAIGGTVAILLAAALAVYAIMRPSSASRPKAQAPQNQNQLAPRTNDVELGSGMSANNPRFGG